jgi:hypothetical protein
MTDLGKEYDPPSQEEELKMKTGRRKEVPIKFALSGSSCVSADEGRWGWRGGKLTVYLG